VSPAGLQAVSCQGCGGAVAMPAGAPHPRCLFCGSEAVVLLPTEDVELPGTFLPFEVAPDAAQGVFRDKAQASIWYPGDLRDATLELEQILLPAWVWSGQVETHWAALVRAGTRSGKRPETGSDAKRVSGVLVPSSSAISRTELDTIAPFSGANAFIFHAQQAVAPFELGKLTRSAARKVACDALAEQHRAELSGAIHAKAFAGSHLFRDLEGEPLLLPVYVGAYRRRGKLHRVVINGQSGKITGEFPKSWLRMGCAFLLVSFILGAMGLALMLLLWVAAMYV
jgi:hypothetical protein